MKKALLISYAVLLAAAMPVRPLFAQTSEPAATAAVCAVNVQTVQNLPFLQYGNRGENVRILQTALSEAGYPVEATGLYGRATLAQVRALQRANGMTGDGGVHFGPRTKSFLAARIKTICGEDSGGVSPAEFRKVLNAFGQQYAAFAVRTSAEILKKNPQATSAALPPDIRSGFMKIADTLGSIYGAAMRTALMNTWQAHLDFFDSYANAARSGDQARLQGVIRDFRNKALAFTNGAADAILRQSGK